ncbi:MAG: trypsin-like serine protease [Cryomorphaceae bacterium]|nr:trypsin-like serine protease [Cryomorphaceae bacterium]
MKSNFKVLSISLFCSILTFFIFNNLIKNNEIDYEVSYEIDNVPQYSLNALSNQSNFSSSSSLPDLTFAASKSIDAVVHVKNTSIVEESDRWSLQFFYGDDSKKKVGTGSGVIISPDGYIITNYHVIENSTEVIVTTNDNKEYEAEIIGIDEVYDIAVLKINSDLNLDYVFFGDSDSTLVGEWVLAVGNPYNLNSTVTAGIISSKSRDLNEYDQKNQSFIQTDAAVNFGNSGGALVNTKGELIGINTLIQSMTGGYVGYSFAVPSNTVRKIFEDILEYGDVQKGLLGVRGVALNSPYSKQLNIDETEGFYIDEIESGYGADLAGLVRGDIIKSIDGFKINRFSDLSGYLSSKRPGDKVKVKFVRDGKLETAEITLKKSSN